MGRLGYPPQYGRKVLDLPEEGWPVALDLDIGHESTYAWRRQDRIDSGIAPV